MTYHVLNSYNPNLAPRERLCWWDESVGLCWRE